MKLRYFIDKISEADCHELLPLLPKNSIDLVLTSPPYDAIRTYETKPTFDLHLLGKQIYKVLKPGGVAIMVIQDQTKDFAKSGTTFKTIADWINTGFKLFECCIYYRPGVPGNWWTSRFKVNHEYIPIFFKGSKPAHFDKLHMMHRNAGYYRSQVGRTMGRRHTDGSVRKTALTYENDRSCCGTVLRYAASVAESTDHIPTDAKRKKLQHPATFPHLLASDFIRCFTKPNEIVLDPFSGSGTTSVVACNLNRRFIGIEINPKYVKLSRDLLRREKSAILRKKKKERRR